MGKKNQPTMNIFVIAFMLASAAISYMLMRVYMVPDMYIRLGRRCGELLMAIFVGLWIYHIILSKKCQLNAANTWFCYVIVLICGELVVWGIYEWDKYWLIGILMGLFFLFLPIYCGMSNMSGWIVLLTIALEVAATAYLYLLDNPQTTGTIYKAANGLYAFAMLVAVIQTVVDVSRGGKAYALEKKAERERRAAEREAARIAERREKLPLEIAAMQGYSLSIVPFITYLQSLSPNTTAYDRMLASLLSYSKNLSKTACEKNEEAEKLGIRERVQIHSV